MGGIKGGRDRFLWCVFPSRAERRIGAAPLTDLKMSCFDFPLLSLFLQEATSRWAPNPWPALAMQCAVHRCNSATMVLMCRCAKKANAIIIAGSEAQCYDTFIKLLIRGDVGARCYYCPLSNQEMIHPNNTYKYKTNTFE